MLSLVEEASPESASMGIEEGGQKMLEMLCWFMDPLARATSSGGEEQVLLLLEISWPA